MIIDSVEDGDTVDAKHCLLTREGTAPCELPYVCLHRFASRSQSRALPSTRGSSSAEYDTQKQSFATVNASYEGVLLRRSCKPGERVLVVHRRDVTLSSTPVLVHIPSLSRKLETRSLRGHWKGS